MRLTRATRLTLAGIASVTVACSPETAPSPDTGMGGGTIDPGASAFLITLEDGTDPNRPVQVDLVGENLEVDATEETISVDVALVNRGAEPLFAPLLVQVGAFRPETVTVVNPDVLEVPNQFPGGPPPLRFGFDYTELLGDDGMLDPDEASAPKTWVFHDPGLGAFSFAARVAFEPEPPIPNPHVGGFVYHDANRNGRRDRGEGPGKGAVEVAGPGGSGGVGFVRPTGRWFVPVETPGLHRVTFFDPTDGLRQWVATTSNPIEVVLPPDPDGGPSSFSHADFGAALQRFGGNLPAVSLTDRRPEEIPQDPYRLIAAELRGDVFSLRVQYAGGCRPEHPLVLWASGDFRDSNPVQTWMLLAHDDLGDPCEALVERSVAFDLGPIRRAYVDAFGQPGVVVLNFLDFVGNRHTFEFGP